VISATRFRQHPVSISTVGHPPAGACSARSDVRARRCSRTWPPREICRPKGGRAVL